MNTRAFQGAAAYTNRYCTTCLQTRRFLEEPSHVVCETCRKRLEKVEPDLAVKR